MYSLILTGKWLGLAVSLLLVIWAFCWVKRPSQKSMMSRFLFIRVALVVSASIMFMAFIGCWVEIQWFKQFAYVTYAVSGTLVCFGIPWIVRWIYKWELVGSVKFVARLVGILLIIPPGQFLIKLLGL
ncbi:MAG: hypothetical protein PHN39_00740 [Candidatus Pacebacteria bacterium]|nr:hypothetical protein [Candidatus Paceibacterota bacterium]